MFSFNGSGVYRNRKEDKPEAYRVNGKDLELGEKEYMPDLMHDQAVGFIRQNQAKPFFLYYSMVHVHGDIQPTPDSAPDSKDLFGDNILYMDKLVGKLTRDVYASRQSDAEAAGKRFDKWDADQDGFLTREEYIHRNQEP
ncbi:MAG: sulfatase-like hydrolase/transferase [Fuerstia sp.]|nr:sulfatase-like hydrolase/transferase [Fuerstiella sp.]